MNTPTSTSPVFRNLLVWILGAVLMAAFSMMGLSAAYADGQYIPAHNDAFYHARRILDAVMTGQPVAQFDTHMHVPEGSWVTWPWGFDTAMAALTRLFGPFATEQSAAVVLLHIPVFAGAVAVALVVWIANLLRLRLSLTVLLTIAFVCLPSVNSSYTVGNVDHDFAESLWTSLAFCCGIRFFRAGDRIAPAILAGLVLGSACAVHMSLFVLQVPFVAYYLIQWLRGETLPTRRATAAFTASLVATALAISLPSEPFRHGFFELYTLSWFHFYIAIGTAVFTLLPAWFARRPVTMGVFALLGILALVPILGVLDFGAHFLGGEIDSTQGIAEIYSPYAVLLGHIHSDAAPPLGWLLWLAVPSTAFAVYLFATAKDAGNRYFALAAALGLALLQLQSRMHVFGELALCATPLLAAQWAADRWPAAATRVALTSVLVFVVALIPIKDRMRIHWRMAGAEGYAEIRGVFPVMKQVCAAHPGVLLADTEAGHWIRYHSACSVIGNLFLLTPQQAAKAKLTDDMMTMTPAQIVDAKPIVSYVLVYHTLAIDPRHEPDLDEFRARMPRLEGALLGPPDTIPPQYRLLWALNTPAGQPYARLFAIERAPL